MFALFATCVPTRFYHRSPDRQGVEFVFGMPWTPSQFVMQAVAAGHPCAMQAALPDVLRSAIAWNARTSEREASAFRNMWFQKWMKRALELRASELKAGLDGDVASILRSKRLCLWKEMLHEYGYPDVGVLDEIQNGTVLTGKVPYTGLFNPMDKPASLSEDCLKENADGLFRMLRILLFGHARIFMFSVCVLQLLPVVCIE